MSAEKDCHITVAIVMIFTIFVTWHFIAPAVQKVLFMIYNFIFGMDVPV